MSRGATALAFLNSSCWAAISGLPLLIPNLFLLYSNNRDELQRLEHFLEEKRCPSVGMFAGEAKKLSLSGKWTRWPSTPLMSLHIESIPEDNLAEHNFEGITTAKKEDYDRILQCLTDCFGTSINDTETSFFAHTARYIDQHPSVEIFIAEKGGKFASMVISVLVEDSVVLFAMGTVPEYRRLGLARKVMLASFSRAKAQGASRVLLYTTEEGKFLYKSLGFETLEMWSFYSFSP